MYLYIHTHTALHSSVPEESPTGGCWPITKCPAPHAPVSHPLHAIVRLYKMTGTRQYTVMDQCKQSRRRLRTDIYKPDMKYDHFLLPPFIVGPSCPG